MISKWFSNWASIS